MRTQYGVADMTIHRIVEQQYGFTPIREFFPSLTPEVLDAIRSWLAPAGLDRKNGVRVSEPGLYQVQRTPALND